MLCAELNRQIYLLQGGSHIGREESGEREQKEEKVCREAGLRFSHRDKKEKEFK